MGEVDTPLWTHQKEIVARAKYTDCFALFADPGTGKTRSVIEITKDKIAQNKKGYNVLVITPLVVVPQFRREFLRFTDMESSHVLALSGTGHDKVQAITGIQKMWVNNPKKFVLVTNYETLYNDTVFNFLKDFTEILIVDESTRCKEITAKRTKRCVQIADNAKFRYIMTGTPILNSQLDIFAQFRILDGGKTFGKNFYLFRATHFHDKNAGWKGSKSYFPEWVPKADCSKRIQDAIRPLSFHIKKEECMDLPALVREEIFIELTASQRKQYDSMKNSLIAFLNDKACVAEMALTKCLRLQQIVSGFMKFDDDTEKSFLEFPKLTALKDLLSDIAPAHKVIVWAIFKKNYSDIKAVCESLNLPTAELHGDISDKDAEVKRFMEDPVCRVMIANPAAGGIGVNLTCASYSIFYSRGFSLESDIQAEARNHRGGTTEALSYMGKDIKVTRIDLIAKDTIDELIMLAIRNKLATSNEILSMLREKLK